ncbi:MAG: condensation domain-containing protein, partial [Planctomycetota bacterium]
MHPGKSGDILAGENADAPCIPPPPPIRQGERDDPVPASNAQERLWFIDRLTGPSPLYNVPTHLRLEGRLDRGALEKSLAEIVRRHEALRTVFAEQDGRCIQIVRPPETPDFPFEDLSGIPAERRSAAAEAAAVSHERGPFDLSTGPLTRFRLLRLDERTHWMLATMHHAVTDGWSVGIFHQELLAAYRAFSQGEEPTWPPLPVQFADYACWRRRWLSENVLDALAASWARTLVGAPPVLDLPTDRPRAATDSLEGRTVQFRIAPATREQLKKLNRETRTTPFMALLAATAAFLHRICGQAEVVIGTPSSGRNILELEGLIGFFVETLALRVDLGGAPSLREILPRVRKTILDATSRPDPPFERLVRTLNPPRQPGVTPVYQATFSLDPAFTDAEPGPDLRARGFKIDSGTAKTDLSVTLQEEGAGFQGELQVRKSLFEEKTAERMAERLRTFLEAALENPDQPVGRLPLMPPDERQRVLVEWNRTETDYPRGSAVPALFSEWAARAPGAEAVRQGDASLTYGELERESNRLARRLRALGAGPGTTVAISQTRSLSMVTGLLGILKAGAAYVPVDLDDPPERLAYLLADSGAIALVAGPGSAAPAGIGLPVVSLGGASSGPDGDDSPLDRKTSPEALACLIYTSGSTGRPKGVEVLHRGLVRLVRNTNVIDFHPSDAILVTAPLTFDASAFHVWGA